jgi:hypothetical protein
MSVRPSAWNNGSHWTGFREIWYLSIFRKNCRENSSFFKTGQEWRVLYMKTNIHFWSYLSKLFLEWEVFRTKFVEKVKTHFVFNKFFFRKSCFLWDNVEKYCRGWTCHRCGACELHAGYLRLQTHTLRTRDTYWFSTATMVARCASMLRYTHIACLC